MIEFSDFLPINLSGYNSHNLRFWIDDNHQESITLNISTTATSLEFSEISRTCAFFKLSEISEISRIRWRN